MGTGIFGWIVIGLLAGWIASMVMNRHHGLLINLIIGLIGGVLGGWLAHFMGFYAVGFLSQFLVALAGAVALLFILGLMNRKKIE